MDVHWTCPLDMMDPIDPLDKMYPMDPLDKINNSCDPFTALSCDIEPQNCYKVSNAENIVKLAITFPNLS